MQKRSFLQGTLLAATLLSGLPLHAQSVDAPTVVRNYAALVSANYQDVLTSAQTLQKAIGALAASPSAQGLEDAKKPGSPHVSFMVKQKHFASTAALSTMTTAPKAV